MGLYNDDVEDAFDPTKRKPLQDNLGMGPAMVAAPSAMAPITPRIGRSVSDTGVPMYNQGDSVPATGHAAEPNPHLAEINRMEGTGSGVSQVQAKHPFWGGVLRGLDVAASLAVPGFATVVPGTTMHHNALIQQQEGLANQDVAREHEQAQTQEIQQRPQMQQAEMEHQEQIEAQKEAARQAQQVQAQREAQDHLDQQTQAQEDRSEQQDERATESQAATEERQGRQFAEQEKLAGIREAGMEHRAAAAASAGQSKVDQKQSQQLQSVIDEAAQAHVDKDLADKGNAPADVDLALTFFKTMKGAGSSGIRFTQQEQKMILGARSSGQSLTALAQKVIGEGQPLTPEQRAKMVQVIDTHAQAAHQAMQRLQNPRQEDQGIQIERDANGRIISVR